MVNKLYKIKDKKKNNELVKLIRVRWSNLRDETEKTSKEEIENEKPNQVLETVNEILDFNKKIQKQQEGSGLKILTQNQMLLRLLISLAQLKTRNNSEKLKNEIRQLLYSLYRSNNLQNNSIKVWLILFKTIFMNTGNSKTSESHRFKLDLTDKLNLKNPNKNMALANLSIYYTWKNIKSNYNNNKFKISEPTWNYTFDLPDGSYSIANVQDILNLSSKT